jgi:D-serine deaminase-like pyridoxal phosphate-dependent protein
MEDIIKLISETGVLLIIAGVFIWDKVTTAKKTEEILREVQEKVRLIVSIGESMQHRLDLMGQTQAHDSGIIAENRQLLINHDNRSQDIYVQMKGIETLLNSKLGKNEG